MSIRANVRKCFSSIGKISGACPLVMLEKTAEYSKRELSSQSLVGFLRLKNAKKKTSTYTKPGKKSVLICFLGTPISLRVFSSADVIACVPER